jgi:hypothetical protein
MPIAAFLGVSRTIDRLQDREIAAALGDMVIAWSAAEYSLIEVFATVAAIPWPMASAAYYQMPTYESRTKVLSAMLAKWETAPFPVATLVNEINALSRLSKTRNHWVHGYWVQQLMGPTISTFDMRGPEPREAKPVKAADISNHVAAVQRRTRAIQEALHKEQH